MDIRESSSDGDMVVVDFKATTSKKGGKLHCILQPMEFWDILSTCRCQTLYLNTQNKVYVFVQIYVTTITSVHVSDSRTEVEALTSQTPTKKPGN